MCRWRGRLADAVQQCVHDPGGQQVRVGLGLTGADRGVEQALVGPARPQQIGVGADQPALLEPLQDQV